MQEVKKRRQMVECNKAKHAEDYRDRDYISCQENGMLHSMAALNGALTKIAAVAIKSIDEQKNKCSRKHLYFLFYVCYTF